MVSAAIAILMVMPWVTEHPLAQSDLDAFMQQVLAERDSNWKKLQQYVLDEREQIEMRGPSGTNLWGEKREFTWYVRDGFFVRSPLKVNGAAVSEGERQKYEQTFLEREQKREARVQAARATTGDNEPIVGGDAAPTDVDGLIKQSRQPQFISSAYFLRFTFDTGRYALVGRERLDDQDVLRIEYYPEKLFRQPRDRARENETDADRRRSERRSNERSRNEDAEMRRLMNKSSKVTLWIEPNAHQIVKYTFDDLGWSFFPGQWLAQMDGVSASMTMGQPFPGVWLPHGLEMNIRMVVAVGSIDLNYTLQYENYRQPDVRSKITVPEKP